MMQPDLQRIAHIRDYCEEIQKTIARYGNAFESFDNDADYQRSVSFSILQIGELSGGLSLEFRRETANRVQRIPLQIRAIHRRLLERRQREKVHV